MERESELLFYYILTILFVATRISVLKQWYSTSNTVLIHYICRIFSTKFDIVVVSIKKKEQATFLYLNSTI